MKGKKKEILKDDYIDLLKDLSSLLEAARKSAVRSVNAIMAVIYWHIGRSIVVYEQQGKKRGNRSPTRGGPRFHWIFSRRYPGFNASIETS